MCAFVLKRMFQKIKFFNEFFYIYNFFILKNQTKSRIWLYDFLLNLTQPKADPTGSDRIRIRHPDMYTLLYTVQCVLCMFNVSHQLSHRVLPRNKVQNNQAKRGDGQRIRFISLNRTDIHYISISQRETFNVQSWCEKVRFSIFTKPLLFIGQSFRPPNIQLLESLPYFLPQIKSPRHILP